MKLISCTDYVIEQDKKYLDSVGNYDKIMGYANLLKRQLELGMFIPCDLEGNVLEKIKPPSHKLSMYDIEIRSREIRLYQEAKNRVLFEGVEITKDSYKQTKRTFYMIGEIRVAFLLEFHDGKKQMNFEIPRGKGTIEDLTHLDLTLTDSAIKQIR